MVVRPCEVPQACHTLIDYYGVMCRVSRCVYKSTSSAYQDTLPSWLTSEDDESEKVSNGVLRQGFTLSSHV